MDSVTSMLLLMEFILTIRLISTGNSDYFYTLHQNQQWSHFLNSRDRKFENFIRPNYSGPPTQINVSVTVLGFNKVDEVTMTYCIDLIIKQEWFDHRLKHNYSTPFLGQGFAVDHVWKPDTVFVNSLDVEMILIPAPSEKYVIFQNGRVLSESRYIVRTVCLFDLRLYPLDFQKCFLAIQSYGYDVNHLTYKWDNKPLYIAHSHMVNYNLTYMRTNETTITYNTGEFSALKILVRFDRIITFPILNLFFPCMVLVAVSWMSFWFHSNCVSARVGLGVTTLLTISKLWGDANNRLPRVHYIKAMDVYLAASFGFVLMTVIEFAIVAYTNIELFRKVIDDESAIKHKKIESNSRRTLMRPRLFNRRNSLIQRRNNLYNLTPSYRQKKEVIEMWRKEPYNARPYYFKSYFLTGEPSQIDVISRGLFPLCFVLFNLYFLLYYGRAEMEDVA